MEFEGLGNGERVLSSGAAAKRAPRRESAPLDAAALERCAPRPDPLDATLPQLSYAG
jgi:hypothetical protein